LADSTKPADGERLDSYLVRQALAASRREARSLIAAGHVRVNGYRCAKGRILRAGDVVEVSTPPAAAALTPDFDQPLDVLYYDEDIAVVNKPGLLPCHPLRLQDRLTLMNSVVARFPQAAGVGNKELEGGLVHRLDNGTSGAIMVALNAESFTRLRTALKRGGILRRYVALAQGDVKNSLQLTAPIAHHPRNRRKMIAVHESSLADKLRARPASTAAAPIRRINGFTLLEVVPATGSRHQIRVHLADAGFPIAGDELYGGPAATALAPGRFFLHLSELCIPRGIKPGDAPAVQGESASQLLEVVAPLPDDLQACIRQMSH